MNEPAGPAQDAGGRSETVEPGAPSPAGPARATAGSLAGRVVFVAGASRGIGAAIAVNLAEQGAAVAVAARSEDTGRVPGTIHEVAARIHAAGGRALAVPCDVTDEKSVRAAIAATVAEFGGIDILVANAGVLWLGPVETTPLKRWQLCLDVNLTGVFLVTREVIPHIRARGGGSLVAITTTGVEMTDRGSNAYWVSKAAVERLYTGLATDLRPDNIAVNCLSPSRVVLTEGWQAAGGGDIPAEMVEPPETMGRAAALLASQDGTGITGTVQRSEALLATT
ncbi:SDR family NAD(P)-dependent oxidoreductase [Nocardia jinanensis]|uniref:Short-chain dehydrogenase n=1 Tax=Nocardia jinanensis TaxID=382504 RepID=A0A917RPY4_9NOCA|nr:SDR family NAD(P)-dependent oxidoreductase [Nocardia jinanensis]GGL18605.1 short-chain dehydrogenase [Nocardia jinanensis]